MALSPEELRDRFRATLLGCAIGDALGFPFEGAPPEAIARVPAVAEDFVARPRGRFQKGQYTDDTQMTLALAEAIIAEGKIDGRAIAQRFVLLWREGIILGAGRACTESVERLMAGVPWMSAGAPIGQAGNGAAMRASPVGLFDYDDLPRIARDAEIQAVITHKDRRAQAGSAAIAAAVALNLSSEPLVKDIFCRRVGLVVAALDQGLASEIERLEQIARFEPASAVRVIARAGLPPLQQSDWPGISPFVVPSVLMALYAFLREPDDFRACMSLALRAGGDADSVAAMAGAIAGARLGCRGLPARLRRGVLDAQRLIAVADKLFDLKASQKEALVYAHAGVTMPGRGRRQI
jgi:ADP-ribosylglycohydrolase